MDVFRKQIQGMFGEGYTPPSTHRSVAPSSVFSFGDALEHLEEQEEVDLIALQTTPEEFQQAEIDVGKFELQAVSGNCTPEAIEQLKELRLRQLHVQVQQLVHHVTANTDNLTAGIQTCRSTGTLLQKAIASIQDARDHLGFAGTDASTCLKIAQLHKRNQQLANMMEICSHALTLQQKSAEAECDSPLVFTNANICRVTTFSVKAAVEANEPGSVMGICQATLMLSDLASQLSESHDLKLSIVEPIHRRVQAQQTAVRQLVLKQLQNVCSHEFAAAEFDRLATLHVLDVHSGAELPERIRDTFLHLVASSDQYQPGERAPSLLQTVLAEERNAAQAGKAKSGGGSVSGAAVASPNDSLTSLYRAVPAVKFRGMVERVMQMQFVWLQTFHAMQIHVQSALQEARTVLSAVESGTALEIDWSSGLPHVHVARKSGDSSVGDPSGLGVSPVVRDESVTAVNVEPEGDTGQIQGDSDSQDVRNESSAENGSTAQHSMSNEGGKASSVSNEQGTASSEGSVPNGKVTQNGSANGASHAEWATAGPSQAGSGESAYGAGLGARGDHEAGEVLWGGSAHASEVTREDHGQVIGSLAGVPLSLDEFVKQRERILHGVADVLRKSRVEFGRQAARNIVKLYEARTTVQSEAFHAILRHGLDFAAMVTAFCAEKPDELENDMESLPHDYLLDVVKTTCGQRLFHAFAREQRELLVEALLPIEQCQCIHARPMKKVADAASGALHGSDRAGMTFSWWATAHSFQHRSGVSSRTRRLQAETAATAPSPESLKLISEAVESEDAAATGTKSASSISASHVTPNSVMTGSALAASQITGHEGNEGQEHGGNDDTDAAPRVFLQATRHIARAWAIYGSLLPEFRSTADVPRHIVQAIQSLFEEFMLWTVVTFADVSATTVVRGLAGKHARFFRVIRSLMLRSDKASHTKRYEQQLLAATAAVDSEHKGGASSMPSDAIELQEGVGVGGGTLDRLVRGTIACDALATLARDLLELEPVLREQYAASGDEEMLRVIAELFENTSGQLVRVPTGFSSATGTERVHGSVHEVETVRRRCVEGSVIYNLGTLENNLAAKLKTTSYATAGLTDASNVAWLNNLRKDLNMFVEALVFCTESRSLTQDSLQEIWMMAVMHIDKVVLQGLAECVETSSKLKGFMSSMANAAKSADKRHAKKGLSTDGCMQLSAEVSHLVRLIALAQPNVAGSADVYTLMTVHKWAEGCHNEMAAQLPTMVAQQRMIEQWMSWAATCHRGTQEGKAQCLALFTAVQRLKGVPDSCPWVRDLKAEVLA